MGRTTRDIIRESLTNTEVNRVTTIARKEVKDFAKNDLEKRVATILKNELKGNKQLEKYVLDISKNVLIQLYKNLWVKRNFWSNDLTNKSS